MSWYILKFPQVVCTQEDVDAFLEIMNRINTSKNILGIEEAKL
jgi:hypothetical protein